jgi:hypothetical protein
MAHTVDSISIRGLRKAHLRQLATYIHERDREGWYYGPREQFERRHADLLKLADRIEAIANDEDARLPNDKGNRLRGSLRNPR